MRSSSFSESSRQTTSPAHAQLSVSKRRKTTPRLQALLLHSQSPRTCARLRWRCVWHLCNQCKDFSKIPYKQAIQYLTADYQPTRMQTAQGIQRLTKSLAPYGLTKSEKLQIVNLTPVEPVELYVVRASSWSH